MLLVITKKSGDWTELREKSPCLSSFWHDKFLHSKNEGVRMKFLAIASLMALLSFSASAEVKCFSQYRALNDAIKAHTDATDKVAADSLDSANYVMAMAAELIAQPNARVGGYGYSVQTNAQTMINNVKFLQSNAKTAEAKVSQAGQDLEDCLINN
jgi:hypothetical protein